MKYFVNRGEEVISSSYLYVLQTAFKAHQGARPAAPESFTLRAVHDEGHLTDRPLWHEGNGFGGQNYNLKTHKKTQKAN